MAEGQRVDPFGAFVAAMEDGFIATLASSFLDKSPQCLAYFGLDRLCRFANSNFCRIFGLDPAAAGSATLAGIMGQAAGDRIERAGSRGEGGGYRNLQSLGFAARQGQNRSDRLPHPAFRCRWNGDRIHRRDRGRDRSPAGARHPAAAGEVRNVAAGRGGRRHPDDRCARRDPVGKPLLLPDVRLRRDRAGRRSRSPC